jgi:hypothetical protein
MEPDFFPDAAFVLVVGAKESPIVKRTAKTPPNKKAESGVDQQQICEGGNCAQSSGQTGGITAGTYVAPQLRIPEAKVAKLATALSACSSGLTVAIPSVENPNGLAEQDANNLAAAFAKSRSWKYSGVGHVIHGQDIGPDGPIPDPVGIHIRTTKEHLELADCVKSALKSVGVESVVESRGSGGDSLDILVGNAPNSS